MLDAMVSAEVGDDVFGEDPTINLLQDKAAEITGKEKALFVTTGCLANQLAIKAHTKQGNEVIVEFESHIINYETAAPAVISNVQLLPVKGENGVMSHDDIKNLIKPKDYYFPETTLICLENTHNRAGGTIQPFEVIKEISYLAKKHSIKMHLDGARVFNASVATGIPVKEYAKYFDSISFCFSKGLGAPVGSILCGSAKFIELAHKWRKILGGGMRQAGILAAAGIYALENNVERLKEDHAKAKFFAEEISKIDGFKINLANVHTNIVVFSYGKKRKTEVIDLLENNGVRISSGSYDNLRAVFHLDVSMDEVQKAIEIIKKVF